MRISIPKEEQGTEYELAYPGNYVARIVNSEVKAGPKAEYIEWTFELDGVTQNAEGAPVTGRIGRVFERTTLAEGAKWRLAQLVKAAEADPADFDPTELHGKEIRVDVEVSREQGYKPRNEIKKFYKV